MLLEGTGIYFFLIFIVFLAVYITVKICLANLFKRMKIEPWKAYIPIYTTYVLTEFLSLKKSVFYMSLIPIVHLYYYNIIIGKLLEGFALNPKDSIWFVVIPMYKFPELVFKHPKYRVNEYELTNQFIETQNVLFNKPKEELPDEIKLVDVNKEIEKASIEASNFEQTLEDVKANAEDNIYTSTETEEEKNQVTYVEASKEEPKKEEPIIKPLDKGKPKLCPNCGTKLAPSATVCFMCGHPIN